MVPNLIRNILSIPFHAIDTEGFIENNDNRYLLSAITKKEEEVYMFRFKSPSFTAGPEDINQTDVRYWSFNLGNSATYNFNALKDCLLYTSPSPRDRQKSRMPSSA